MSLIKAEIRTFVIRLHASVDFGILTVLGIKRFLGEKKFIRLQRGSEIEVIMISVTQKSDLNRLFFCKEVSNSQR